MRQLHHALVAALVLAGCGGKSTNQPPADTICDQVAERLLTTSRHNVSPLLTAEWMATWEAKMRPVIVASCNEDGWPAEVKACVVNAASDESLDKCDEGQGDEPAFAQKFRARSQTLTDELNAALAAAQTPLEDEPVPPGEAEDVPAPDGND